MSRVSIFPLPGALLLPGMELPLHIFEPRYQAMIHDAMARDRRIGMIQPREEGTKPALFDVGCLGHITHIEALEGGRYNILLKGLARFRVVRELDVPTAFRQIEADVEPIAQEDEILSAVERAALEQESRRFADALGYVVDWTAVSRLDDMALVNGIAQIVPFDPAAKQTLLEADTLGERADRIIQLMQIVGRIERDGGATMQ
ncbi:MULTISPECIES: LON peptidase substrate-binding domain-containing protein [Sphingobium]|jgi:Lon protease-like protein|uniref:ATP-dependent protease n=1 Tax=Sphingobium fuliginis (strain ATCC 27551) TaxID=336203 RepID=A0A292ZHG6_SPHSA|nr:MULTISPECIES: LON peptidase substrate-binding domain-containing protein [Sphingobium]AJR22645.1 ATP-dependent protease [Sphingobium sp. YBL2]MCB4861393.1 LON peptidase substrate-binding domain-containing protein [Sphingobium sp. PNB]QOT70587.1 LON peptidase substrate-binding domain-containing protein [Sphingobium fuliginis]RYM01017.1 ATP-dependent protease [Sphingobium fuliginis]UXC89652.1 LON peptidase substrate-binding domain-containing protein [Sphingobium sp. RSMS]